MAFRSLRNSEWALISDDGRNCYLYYTVTILGFTVYVTTELTCGFPLTLLPFSSGCRFALCRRCSLDHPSTEMPLVPSALFCMAPRPFSSSAMEMSPGAVYLLVMCPESLAMTERCWGGCCSPCQMAAWEGSLWHHRKTNCMCFNDSDPPLSTVGCLLL